MRMTRRRWHGLIALLSLVLLLSACGQLNPTSGGEKPAAGLLQVHYLDVGQADAILVQFPAGVNLLIDAGNDADAPLVINYLRQVGVETLNIVVGTHPHADHIGALDDVILAFPVGDVYLPNVIQNTRTFENLLEAIDTRGLSISEAKAGVELPVGAGAAAVILAPVKDEYAKLNDYSVVIRAELGEHSFLFTGDAEVRAERDMLESGAELQANVLKVGHHGGATSTSGEFLERVQPEYAVISVGRDNEYGHPHLETMARLAEAGVAIYRTDQQGTIVAITDGVTLEFNEAAIRIPRVTIVAVDRKAEVATIRNDEEFLLDITGWKLVSEVGNQIYTIPAGTTLGAGQSLQIVSGPQAKPAADTLVWTTNNIWNNDHDPAALYDADGNLIHRLDR
ncbi:MAG: MBL fold metallo-hydrolase [Bacillota bacterium]|jgi:competence protein ComEC